MFDIRLLIGGVALAVGAAPGTSRGAVIFSQNFSSSTNVASYVGAPPNNGQFDQLARDGVNVTISITGGALTFVRSGNVAYFTRSTDFSPAPTSLLYQFDLSTAAHTLPQVGGAVWYVGQDMPSAAAEPNAATNVYARFALNLTNTAGQFQLRHLDTDGGAGPDASVNSATFTGTQTVRWYLNNSGGPLAYTAPNGAAASVGDDRYDLWLGNTLVFDEFLTQSPTLNLTDLKFMFSAGQATLRIDNILIQTPAPEPASAAAISVTAGIAVLRRRRRVVRP